MAHGQGNQGPLQFFLPDHPGNQSGSWEDHPAHGGPAENEQDKKAVAESKHAVVETEERNHEQFGYPGLAVEGGCEEHLGYIQRADNQIFHPEEEYEGEDSP